MNISDLKNYTVISGASHVSVPQDKQPEPLVNKVTDFFGAKGLTDLAGSEIAKFGLTVSGNTDAAKRVQDPSLGEVVGSAIQTGANFIPGAGIGAGIAKKALAGAASGYALDVGSKLQQGKSIPESVTPGLGTGVGAALPVGGALLSPATRVVGRLLKGLGSGLSGVSTDSIDKIISNPEEALKVSQQLQKTGNSAVLENNAKQIVNGVSKIRQEARTAYGEGLSQLKTEDINPTAFHGAIKPFLDKNGVSIDAKSNTRFLDNVEFNDPKNLQTASNLIDELSKVKLDGLSLRNLLTKVEDTRYKTATSDERLSFNAFTKDLASTIKSAISGSTDKLNDINKAFSNDMQLAEATQNIFGKVDFKNLPEVVRASQRLEGLFAQKGLAPDVVDSFLTRIGISPEKFKTSEAVRQISNKSSGANTKGLSVGEVMQQATSAVITPQMIKNLSIVTGLAKENLQPFLEKMKPAARNTVINALLQANQ